MRKTGIYEILGKHHYFIPDPLPPIHPTLQLNLETFDLYGQTLYNLGMLNETSKRIPDLEQFIKAYIIKEALLSSAIEGIHTTLIDVFNQTQDGFPKINKSTQLVVNYIQALHAAIDMMQHHNLPISSRVICAAHQALLSGKDGDYADPGNYRKQTVKVGNLVPAPSQKISNLMSDLEKYINEDTSLPVLIKAGLVHLQFETIHPFLDGNGRIGRLLIMLMLIDGKLLDNPILYISYYFKKHHLKYYQMLDKVRTDGDFEGWINFYLQAVNESALDANIRAKEIELLQLNITNLIKTEVQSSSMQETTQAVIKFFFTNPVTTIPQIGKETGRAYNTINKIILKLMELGLISEHEVDEHKRYKQYRFNAYLELLEKEFE